MTDTEMVEKYRPLVRNTARKFCRRNFWNIAVVDADDLQQEAFLSLLRSHRDNGNVNESFVFIVAYNAYNDLARHIFRKIKKSAKAEFLPLAESACDRKTYVMDETLQRELVADKAMRLVHGRRAFSGKRKAAFRMYYLEGLTQDEIACRLGMAQSAVGRNLRRAEEYVRAAFVR